MKEIKKGEYFEPNLDETFIYDKRKMKCVRDSISENLSCSKCCLSVDLCNGIKCNPYDRADHSGVHIIDVEEVSKEYQIYVSGEAKFDRQCSIKDAENLLSKMTLKAGDLVEIFKIENVKKYSVKTVNEKLDTYEKAREYMENYPIYETDKAALAMHKLLTIAAAWNKADGFVIDINDKKQNNWFPTFTYANGSFIVDKVLTAQSNVTSNLGGRLCFRTAERAKQFGTQFIDLWNDFLLIK